MQNNTFFIVQILPVFLEQLLRVSLDGEDKI